MTFLSFRLALKVPPLLLAIHAELRIAKSNLPDPLQGFIFPSVSRMSGLRS
jgi:hypothetical protein